MTPKSTSLFAQIIACVIQPLDFARIVNSHKGDKHSKGLRCRDQLVAMLFLHLSKVTSLREISHGLRSVAGKVVHLGMGKVPGASTLSYANAHRPAEIYRETFYAALERCSGSLRGRKPFRFKNKLLSMDATFIQLCLSLFSWAKFRPTKGAVKLHMLYDHDGYFPVYACVTDGKHHEAPIAQAVMSNPDVVPQGSIVVFDRGYFKFDLFHLLTSRDVTFVTRIKEGLDWECVGEREVPRHRHIVRDDDLRFFGPGTKRSGQQLLRRVIAVDPDSHEEIVLLTNNWSLGASTIARIYKDRWQIEIFFKTLKQHLKIKTFVGTNENALLIQIWTALICVLALKLLKALSTFGWSMSNLVSMIRLTLFSHRDLRSWLDHPFDEPPWEPDIQLSLPL